MQHLSLTLHSEGGALELFTILQTNTTVKALNVKILHSEFGCSSTGTGLQKMLTQNKTLQYLKIRMLWGNDNFIPHSYLTFLTTGLISNTNLQELSVPIPLGHSNEQIKMLFNVLSQKSNLTQLHFEFTLDFDWPYMSMDIEKGEYTITTMFHEQILPLLTQILQSHKTITLLKLRVDRTILYQLSEPNWMELAQSFCESVYLHSSLEYLKIDTFTDNYFVEGFLILEEAFTAKQQLRSGQGMKNLIVKIGDKINAS